MVPASPHQLLSLESADVTHQDGRKGSGELCCSPRRRHRVPFGMRADAAEHHRSGVARGGKLWAAVHLCPVTVPSPCPAQWVQQTGNWLSWCTLSRQRGEIPLVGGDPWGGCKTHLCLHRWGGHRTPRGPGAGDVCRLSQGTVGGEEEAKTQLWQVCALLRGEKMEQITWRWVYSSRR